MLVLFRLITSGRPRVRRTVVVDSLVEHLTVDFGHNYSRLAFSSSYPFALGTSRSQGEFSVIPTKLAGKRPSSPVKTAEM